MLPRLLAPFLGLALAVTLGLSACRPKAPGEAPKSKGAATPTPRPRAQFGGTLVALGEGAAYLEVKLKPETGTLTFYVLDGQAQHRVRIAQNMIELKVTTPSSPAPIRVLLGSVANALTREAFGSSSEFEAQPDALKGVAQFQATITSIIIQGQTFENVAFSFPEGQP